MLANLLSVTVDGDSILLAFEVPRCHRLWSEGLSKKRRYIMADGLQRTGRDHVGEVQWERDYCMRSRRRRKRRR